MRRFSLAAMGYSAVAGTTFLVNESCEGTGTPAGWTNVGSPNWDYSAVPLADAQSVYMATAGASVRSRIDWADLTEVFVYFLLRFTNGTGPAAGSVALGAVSENGSAASRLALTVSSAERLAFGGSPTATISVDTTYHVWLRYKQGTGANAEGEIGFSTDGVRPTSGTNWAVTLVSSLTNLGGRLWLGPSAATLGYDVIFDNIRVAATQIGDNGT